MKISNLLEKDLKIVEKKKIFFLVPAIIVAVAAIFMLIYGLTSGSPLNLGTDFTGGYSMDIQLGTKLTTDTQAGYEKQIKDIFGNLKDDEGNAYNVKIRDLTQQGEGSDASIRVLYDADYSEQEMSDTVNPLLQKRLADAVFEIVPTALYENNSIVVDYNKQFSFADNSYIEDFTNKDYLNVKAALESVLAKNSISYTSIERSEDAYSIIIAVTGNVGESVIADIAETATIEDKSFGGVYEGLTTTASFSSELLWRALAAILASVVLMLIYIAFRFELTSGISAIVALFHDIIIMFCFMIIFHIEINSTFVAALITILGYSINNTIIIFDRIRENRKTMDSKELTATYVANKSVSETLVRSVNTTLTTLLTIGMVAILGVRDIKIFALPIIIGLLAGTYSSIFISPSIWASWKDRKKKDAQSDNKKAKKAVVSQAVSK